MRARSTRPLIAGLVVALVAGLSVGIVPLAEAADGPQIDSPSSGTPEYEGFTGPYEVDFSNAPAGDYHYSLTNDQGDVVPPTPYHSSGTETHSFHLVSLNAGTYTFHVANDSSEVVPATRTFTVRDYPQPTCSVAVPRRVRVNSGEEIVTGRLTSACASAHVSYASWDVRHVTGAFHDQLTFDHTASSTTSFFGPDRLGIYVVRPTTAINPAADDIVQNSPRIDVRLDSRLRLSSKRVARYVTLTATLTRYVRSTRKFTGWRSRPVTVSYRACGTCTWHVVKTRSTGTHGVVTFRLRSPNALRWRVTSPGTPTIWAPYAAYSRR